MAKFNCLSKNTITKTYLRVFFLVLATSIISKPVVAQNWSGINYSEDEYININASLNKDSMNIETELELRNLYKQNENSYYPDEVKQVNQESQNLKLVTNEQMDTDIQTEEHLLPIIPPFLPNVPGAVEDKSNDLNNTVCSNKYYKGRAMVVDISDQRARIYEPVSRNGVLVCTNVATFKVTTGKKGYETPVGDYYLSELERVRVGKYTVDWMSFKNSGNTWWGIHQAPWQTIGFGTITDSKGCVRFQTKEWSENVKPLMFKYLFFRIQE